MASSACRYLHNFPHPHLICEDPVCIAACGRTAGGMIALLYFNVWGEMQKNHEVNLNLVKIWFLFMLPVTVMFLMILLAPRTLLKAVKCWNHLPVSWYATERFLSRWNRANYINEAPVSCDQPLIFHIAYCSGSATLCACEVKHVGLKSSKFRQGRIIAQVIVSHGKSLMSV